MTTSIPLSYLSARDIGRTIQVTANGRTFPVGRLTGFSATVTGNTVHPDLYMDLHVEYGGEGWDELTDADLSVAPPGWEDLNTLAEYNRLKIAVNITVRAYLTDSYVIYSKDS